MSSKQKRAVVMFTGHVQGVGFRMTAVHQSSGLGVHGFVRNEPDGSVTLDVEGPPRDVAELLQRIETAMSEKIDTFTVDDREPIGRTGGLVIKNR